MSDLMRKEVIVIGASGHGKVIADIIKCSGDKFIGFLDDDASKKGVLGKVAECEKYKDKYFIIGIGNNAIRRKIAEKYPNLQYYIAVHPTAVMSENVSLGNGTVVMANVVVNANAQIGDHCILNTSCVVEHDNIIANYVHISPGAVLCGTVRVGENTHIGASVVVKNNITITNDVQIGCGGVVVKDIELSGTYVGIPVKEL